MDNPRRTAWKPIAAVVACVLLPHGAAGAQATRPHDYEVEAVYLYNFSRFVTWPPQAAAPDARLFSVCVLGSDPFGVALDKALAGESIDGRSVVARRISRPQDAADCRILFVSESEEKDWPRILLGLGGSSILTVSDMPQFVARGGAIQFVTQDNKVRFEVNLPAAEQAGLTLSSNLLKVAAAVRRGAGHDE